MPPLSVLHRVTEPLPVVWVPPMRAVQATESDPILRFVFWGGGNSKFRKGLALWCSYIDIACSDCDDCNETDKRSMEEEEEEGHTHS